MQKKTDGISTKDDEKVTFPAAGMFGRGRWLAVAMLVTLHFALWSGTGSIWSRPALFVHLGFFLLWQPLWGGEKKLRPGRVVIIVGVSVLALLWLNWWVLAFWVSGLFSLVGGGCSHFRAHGNACDIYLPWPICWLCCCFGWPRNCLACPPPARRAAI